MFPNMKRITLSNHITMLDGKLPVLKMAAVYGANGAGKSTFLKVLSGELEPSKGEVTKEKTERISVLKQNHFAYEDETVMDTVIMGNERLYDIMKEKDAIYAKEDFTE